MMTLIEAIEHCKDMAKCEYGECAEEHRQLAEWLMELQDIKTHGPTVDKEYLVDLIQEAVYDGEACAKLMDLVDRPTGEWIMHGEPPWYVRECSKCGTRWHQWFGDSNPNYCGHCGSMMTGGEDSD